MDILFTRNDNYLEITSGNPNVTYIRFTTTGSDVSKRNKVYYGPIYIGNDSGVEVVKAVGFDANDNYATEQGEYLVNEVDEQITSEPADEIQEVAVEESAPTFETEVTEEIPSATSEVEDPEESDDQPELFDTSELESHSEGTEPKPMIEEVQDEVEYANEINHTIENNKANIVRIIFKIQLNAFDVSVLRAPTFMEEKYFYASMIDALAKVTQFKPSEVKVEIGRFSTAYIRKELVDKGYNVIYIT